VLIYTLDGCPAKDNQIAAIFTRRSLGSKHAQIKKTEPSHISQFQPLAVLRYFGYFLCNIVFGGHLVFWGK
jgi:hypothetical protein